ncbi:MAG: hypothetical protein ACJAYU_004705 [Bradymonadia bacterium]
MRWRFERVRLHRALHRSRDGQYDIELTARDHVGVLSLRDGCAGLEEECRLEGDATLEMVRGAPS